jgi:O-antigen/teichoic acid export membrane protein
VGTLSNRLIIAAALGVAATGIYGAASRFALVMEFAVGVFALSWAESAALHIDDADRMEFFSTVFDKALRLLGGGALLVVMLAAVMFKTVVGRPFEQAYQYIPLLVLGALLHGIVELYSGVYIATKRTMGAAKTSLLAAGVNLVAVLTLIRAAGLWAPALGTVAGFGAMAMARHFDLRKVLSVRPDMRLVTALAAASAAVIWCYYQQSPQWSLVGTGIAASFAILVNWSSFRSLPKGLLAGHGPVANPPDDRQRRSP